MVSHKELFLVGNATRRHILRISHELRERIKFVGFSSTLELNTIAGGALAALVAVVIVWLLGPPTLRDLPAPRQRVVYPSKKRLRPDGSRMASAGLRRVVKKANDCRRFKAKISYQGELFCGWQKQGSKDGRVLRTVEETLETSLGAALGQAVRFFPAGRTDSGVSALGQYVTFDAMLAQMSPVGAKPDKHVRGAALAEERARIFLEESKTILVDVAGTPTVPCGLAAAFNLVLPPDLRVLSVELSARNFDPLGETRWKRYCYSFDAPTGVSLCKSLYWSTLQDQAEAIAAVGGGNAGEDGALEAGVDEREHMPEKVRHRVPAPDDASVPPMHLDRMQQAARLLVGTHDFAAFQAKGGRVTTVRTIFSCTVLQDETGLVSITCEGDGFLYKMVRIIAGTLIKIGIGMADPSLISEMLRTLNRSIAGPPSPAKYLTLMHVEYDINHPMDKRAPEVAGPLSASVQERKRERENSPSLGER